jgi:hypothetical protein
VVFSGRWKTWYLSIRGQGNKLQLLWSWQRRSTRMNERLSNFYPAPPMALRVPLCNILQLARHRHYYHFWRTTSTGFLSSVFASRKRQCTSRHNPAIVASRSSYFPLTQADKSANPRFQNHFCLRPTPPICTYPHRSSSHTSILVVEAVTSTIHRLFGEFSSPWERARRLSSVGKSHDTVDHPRFRPWTL